MTALISTTPRQLALICDYAEEGWISMDLCAEVLVSYAAQQHAAQWHTQVIKPKWTRRFAALPVVGKKRAAFNGDRVLNRFVYYPRYLRRHLPKADAFHVVDHSYAQLALTLPKGRTGVFCHDLDAFDSVIDPIKHPRPQWFRKLAARQLRGMQQADLVFYTTDAVRRQIDAHQLIDPARLVKAPLGFWPEYQPDAPQDVTAVEIMQQLGGPFLMHVGKNVPRKRFDVLLDVFGEIHRLHPHLKLLQISGQWKPEDEARMARLGIAQYVVQRRGLPRSTLAYLFSQAALVLQPSDNEGFGIPVIEALACGAAVVASDIPALREVGAASVTLCPVADVTAWVATVDAFLSGRAAPPAKAARLAQAAFFSWERHTDIILSSYDRLLR